MWTHHCLTIFSHVFWNLFFLLLGGRACEIECWSNDGEIGFDSTIFAVIFSIAKLLKIAAFPHFKPKSLIFLVVVFFCRLIWMDTCKWGLPPILSPNSLTRTHFPSRCSQSSANFYISVALPASAIKYITLIEILLSV